jgi:uridine kinase/nicotinic acid mononucleotide adenylyltransferase
MLDRWNLIITTDLKFTEGNVAACDIDAKIVYLHPYFFELDQAKQLEILYHELISHIAKGLSNELEAMGDTESFFGLKYRNPRSPETKNELDSYDLAHYYWDAVTNYWRSRSNPRLVLGTWEDVKHSSRQKAARSDMENHVAIRMKSGYSVYVFDGHHYSDEYLQEAAERGEIGYRDNQQIWIDDHCDTQDISEPDASIAKDIASQGYLKRHIWVYFDDKLYPSRGAMILGADTVLTKMGIENNRCHYSRYFEVASRPRNTKAIFNIETDVTDDNAALAGFMAKIRSNDGVVPSCVHICTSAPNCSGNEVYGEDDLDGFSYPDGYGTVEGCQFMARTVPYLISEYFEKKEVLAVKKAQQCIDGNIKDFDKDVARKKESFLSRLYHAISATFTSLTEKARQGQVDPYARVNLLKFSAESEDSRLHDIDREVRVGFFPITGNPMNWGHILPPLMAMNALGLDTVVIRVQGEIGYKKLAACERVSVADRHHMVNQAISGLYPLFRYTDLGSEENNDLEGAEEMHRFLELNSNRKIHMHYLIGAEDEARVWRYMRQQYEFFAKYKFGSNSNHKITFAVIQRGEYGVRVTQEELDQISDTLQKETGSNQRLSVVLIKEKDIDLNVSSTYYRNTQDGAFVPKCVHDFAQAHGYYGHPPIDPRTAKPLTDSREQYFRMRLEPVAREMAKQIKDALGCGIPGDNAMVSIDGGSGSGKTTIAEEVAKYLKESGLDTLIIPLDMFLKDRIWRLAIQKLVTGRHLNEAEKKIVGDLADIIQARQKYLDEETFFDRAAILKMLQDINAFRRSREEGCVIAIPNAYDQKTKTTGPKEYPIKKGTIIIFEGKYANEEEAQPYYDLRYRLHDDPDRTEARFQIRSRKLSPNDADMQIIFYGMSLVPSFEVFDRRTEKDIHGFIDLRHEEWFLKNTPDGGSLRSDITTYFSRAQEKFFE